MRKSILGAFVVAGLILGVSSASVFGQPCQYTGKDMKTAHMGMGISGGDFNALVEDLVGALDKFKVPQHEKDQLLGALAPMKTDIVDKK
jgi:hemoglobin